VKFAVASDHAGIVLHDPVVAELRRLGHEVRETPKPSGPVDYPDVATSVTQLVSNGSAARGVLLCGSGVGMSVAATKVTGIRAAVCHDTFSARQGVEDDAMNVLCLGARVVGPDLALEVVRAFAAASFSGAERHVRRLAKVATIEKSSQQTIEVEHVQSHD